MTPKQRARLVERLTRDHTDDTRQQLFDMCHDAAAEIERLRSLRDEWQETYAMCDKSRDAAMDDLAEARAEIERLRKDKQAYAFAYEKRIGELEAEIDRLRARLVEHSWRL